MFFKYFHNFFCINVFLLIVSLQKGPPRSVDLLPEYGHTGNHVNIFQSFQIVLFLF